MRALLIMALVVSGCAGREPEPVAIASPSIVPVALTELRGREALVFPDVAVSTAIAGVERYARDCFGGKALTREDDPHGFTLRDASAMPFLRVMVAEVSKSSALGLDGTGLTPDTKEAIADTVQGRPRCAEDAAIS